MITNLPTSGIISSASDISTVSIQADSSGNLVYIFSNADNENYYILYNATSATWGTAYPLNNISNIDDHKDTEFSIYPNPTSGVLTIHVEPSILEDLEYQILSFDGLVLFSNKLKINSDRHL